MADNIRQEALQCLLEFTGMPEAPDFGDATWIDEFGLDSMGLFHFLLQLEKTLQFRFEEDDFAIASVESFNNLVETIRRCRDQA